MRLERLSSSSIAPARYHPGVQGPLPSAPMRLERRGGGPAPSPTPRPSLRIAWLINLYPPYVVGGNEMLAHDVVVELRKRGHDVRVLTAQGSGFGDVPGVESVLSYDLDTHRDVLFLGARPLTRKEELRSYTFDPRSYARVRRSVRKLEPDLVVVDNLHMASAAPLLAVRSAGCPVVAQVADKWLAYLLRDVRTTYKPTERFPRALVERYARWVQPWLWRLGRPDAIVSVSDFIKQFYVAQGFPAERIASMFLGVDTDLYVPRATPHAGANDLEVVFSGQLWEGKGPQVLVDALGRLRVQEPDLVLRLRVIGNGSEHFKAYLHEEVRRAGMEERTTWDGFVRLPELAARLRQADLFVFPSTWDEPFSITLPAAMASGAAVIATRAGGTPAAFVDGEEGLLVPPGDAEALAGAILKLARDPGLRQRLSQAAIARARRDWSFTAYVDRLERHYLSLAGKN